ncbi:MAG: ABC transporter permease [Sulfurimicrobium sp.]|nr:ABC transporter permease [Sulfurimicrobium sp.]MDP3687086.1 ABC transporter permease [Sulfurimicrobium sp.]
MTLCYMFDGVEKIHLFAVLSEGIKRFWHYRNLILQMTKREVIGRYRGSVMGLFWSLFNPVLMLAVYTLVFSVVFNARWGGGSGSKTEYATILFTGLIVHGLFAECVNRAPGLILSNVNFVKRVVFPLDILPWVALGSALFHAAISMGVLLAFFLALHGYLHWTAIFLPILFLPFLLLIMGVSWFLAATGVYLRDVAQTTGLVTTVLMFLSPVFYPITALPEAYRSLLYLNPLTFIIEEARNLLIWGKTPELSSWALYFAVSLLVAWAGLWWFQKLRKGFADVL